MKYYECHGHIGMGPGTTKEKIAALKKANVTYFRDGGDANGVGLSMKADLQDAGIEFATPVFAIYKAGLYGKYLGRAYENMKDFKNLVLLAKKEGADFAKLVLSGIASFKEPGKLSCPGVPENEIFEMIKICHEEGLAVMVHCNGSDTIKHAICAGADSLEHGIFIDEEGLNMLAKSSTIWVPTITAITNEDLQKEHLASVKKGAWLGCKIASGSDSGAGSAAQGQNTAREHKLIFDCALSEEKLVLANEEIRNRFKRSRN